MQKRKVTINADEANLALSGLLTVAAWATGEGWLMYCGFGALLGLLLNASLASEQHGATWRRWDWFNLGWWWMAYEWLPMAIAQKPVVGTLTRITYILPIGFWVALLLGVVGAALATVGLIMADTMRFLIGESNDHNI